LLIREQLREKHERPTPEVQMWAIIQVVKETPKTRNHLYMTAAGYRPARAKAFRIRRQETYVQQAT